MSRQSSGWVQVGLIGVLISSLGAAAWWTADTLLVSRAVNEGRIVADMAETVGRWASQYGGVHARTQGANAALPGSFLTRSVYAGTDQDAELLRGSKAENRQGEREAEAEHVVAQGTGHDEDSVTEGQRGQRPALQHAAVATVVGLLGERYPDPLRQK